MLQFKNGIFELLEVADLIIDKAGQANVELSLHMNSHRNDLMFFQQIQLKLVNDVDWGRGRLQFIVLHEGQLDEAHVRGP